MRAAPKLTVDEGWTGSQTSPAHAGMRAIPGTTETSPGTQDACDPRNLPDLTRARRMRAIPGTTYGLAGCYTLEGSPAIAAHYLYVHDGMNFPDGTSGLTHLIRMLRVQHQPSADSHLFTRVDKVFNRFNRPSGVAGSNPGAEIGRAHV